MPYNRYIPVSKDRYELLCSRYQKFMEELENPNAVPVKVFDPLSKKHLEELELIREVSRELSKKKDDDMQKAARQAAEAKAEKEAEDKAKEESDELKVNGTQEITTEA